MSSIRTGRRGRRVGGTEGTRTTGNHKFRRRDSVHRILHRFPTLTLTAGGVLSIALARRSIRRRSGTGTRQGAEYPAGHIVVDTFVGLIIIVMNRIPDGSSRATIPSWSVNSSGCVGLGVVVFFLVLFMSLRY